MEQKRTGLSYVFTLAKEERGKLGLGMLLAVFSSALSLVPYMVVYQILLLIIKNEVTLPAILKWAGIGIGAAVIQAIFTACAGICSHTAAFNTMHRIKVRELAQAVVVPLMMFLFMLRLNWKMALIMLIPMILGIAIPMALMGRYPDLTDEFAGDTEKLNASANEFITAMPVIKMYHLTAEKFEQYRTALRVYTDCWVKLSGGQKQRVSIARAILKDTPILLLDESTTSLDADNEAKINQALDHLMKKKTVFVIAHRLNTIQNADQIIVLNDGKIEEMGTHDMLLKKQGHYYAMVQEQQKAKEWIVKGA